MSDLLAGHRQTSFTYQLLDKNLNLVGPLQGVQPGGSLDWSSDRSVKGGGSLTISDLGQNIQWAGARIQIGVAVNGRSWPLGVWVPAIPGEDWDTAGGTYSVSLLDLSRILDVWAMPTTYSVAVGDTITDHITSLITGAGLRAAVTPSPLTVSTAKVWDAGTTRLQILGDLTDMANYLQVFADMGGTIRAVPYQAPSQRTPTWQFLDGSNCIYAPTFGHDQDWDDVPTEVLLTTAGDDTTPGLSSYYRGPDSHPASQANRGFAVTYVEQVDAPDQTTLDALAKRRWVDLSTPTGTITISHMPIPLAVNDAVRFASSRAGLDGTCVVQSTTVHLSATDLAETSLTEVVS